MIALSCSSSRMYRYIAIFLFVSTCFKGYAQEEDFNAVFVHVASELTHTNPTRALEVTDSLYQHSSIKVHKTAALMLASNVYYRKGELRESLLKASKAQVIAEEIKDYDWQIRIQGFYASLYRSIRFYDISMSHLEQIDVLFPKVVDSSKRAIIAILNAQEQAYLYESQNEFDKVIPTLRTAQKYYDQVQNLRSRELHFSHAQDQEARILLKNGDYDESYAIYQNVLEILDSCGFEHYPMYAYAYIGLAKIAYSRDKDTLQAIKYIKKAEPIVKASNVSDLEVLYHSTLRKYYYDNQLWGKYQEEDLKLQELLNKQNDRVNDMLTDLYGEIRTESTRSKAKSRSFLISTYSLLFALILFGGLAFLRHRKNKLLVRNILEELDGLRTQSISTAKMVEVAIETIPKEAFINSMASDTLSNIIEKIETFEEEELFLNPAVSIQDLAAYCSSNVRYVSEVIRNVKNENFTSYINKLRVMHVAKKLNEQKKYRKYKISHLAEVAGFSSHSKFSLEFKKVFNISPSIFINKLP